jgi:hypothetical protein
MEAAPLSNFGHWLCYWPRDFARGRNYSVLSSDPSILVATLDGFTSQAETLLRAQSRGGEPLWRYTWLESEPFVVLLRCSAVGQAGATSNVVWGLLLPKRFLQSPGASLTALLGYFATLDIQSPPSALPLPTQPTENRPSQLIMNLASRYLESGSLRIAATVPVALQIFCEVVTALAPLDRVQISFTTASISDSSLELDSSAEPPQLIPASPIGLARLRLWGLIGHKIRVLEHYQSASLRERVPSWMTALLREGDLYACYSDLLRIVRDHLEEGQWSAAYADIRRALESRLTEMPRPEGAHALTALERNGLLTMEWGIPPMWLARVVYQNDYFGRLQENFAATLVRHDTFEMLIYWLSQPRRLTRLAQLSRALTRAPLQAANSELTEICKAESRRLKGDVRDETLSPVVATLLTYVYAQTSTNKRPS